MTVAGSPEIWYRRFLSTRCVPPVLRGESETTTDCYALTLKSAIFKELRSLENFRVRLCFFDTQYRHFFGRQFISKYYLSKNNLILFDDIFFFHSPIKEESIVVVVEIVEYDKQDNEWVLAWTVIPIFTKSETMTDFSSNVSVPVQFKKFQLYSGTAKLLFFVNSLDSPQIKKTSAVLECCLQTNENLKAVLNYIPEYVVVSQHEHIPGLRRPTEDMPILACPEEVDSFTGVLDNLVVSFGVLPEEIEGIFLENLNRERNYRLNRAPNDSRIPKLEVVERRLRIGIHNGFTFIEDPMVLYLSAKDEMDSGRHSIRRRSRSLSRMSNFIRSEYGTLQVRNSVRLTKLLADEEVAIVFAVDYLVGARYSPESIADSNLVMVCWGAWSPFREGSFTISDTVAVPLIGGPRPNPDEVLCFKNLLRLKQKQSDPFGDGKPRINLTFNFAMVGSTDAQVLLRIPQRTHSNLLTVDSGRRTSNVTPLPKPDFPPGPSTGVIEDVEEKQKEEVGDFHKPRVVTKSKEVKDKIEFEPAELAPVSTRQMDKKQIYGLEREVTGLDMTAIPDVYLTRPSPFPRSAVAVFSKFDFPKILDRNGNQPDFVDFTVKKPISIENMLSSKLETNEIIIQFMGILNVKNPFLTFHPRITKYFFTIQFYRFNTVTTEKLIAHPGSEWKNSFPIPLRRLDENDRMLDREGNGFMVKYTVDRNSSSDGRDFVEYLNSGSVFIDVWNADSLIHVGTCQIPLKFLCRDGNSDAIQANLQCPVVQNGLPQEDTVTALLYLRLANIGHLSGLQSDLIETQNNAIVSKRLHRLGENRYGSMKTRARPLAAIHESALQRFLTAQKLDIHQRKEELFSSENLNRIQQWQMLKKDEDRNVTKASIKRFIFEEELEAYKSVRNESKAAKLLKTVFSSITVPHYIQANFGKVEFFEYCLQNTFAKNVKCQIDISDPKLCPVTNVEEWRFFKSMNNLKTPIEKDLFDFEDDEKEEKRLFIHLRALESVYLPFKFENFEKNEDSEKYYEIKAIFKHHDTGEPISILDLTVQVRNPLTNCQLRWFSEECSKINKLITVPNYGKRIVFVASPDPSILLQLRNSSSGPQELLFTAHSLPSPLVKSLYVFLYSDKYRSTLLSTWKIHIHSVQKLTVEGIQAQTTKVNLMLKPPEESDSLVQFHSTSEALTIFPHQPFVANPKVLSEVQGYFTPNFAGRRLVLVTAVNVNTRDLLNSWMIQATVSAPNVVKTYEITLPLHGPGATKKRISLENHYMIEKNYRIHTSNSSLVNVEKEYYFLKPHEVVPVDLVFHAVDAERGFIVDVLVFVEDSDLAQQEEAYLLKITYSESQ